MDVPFHLCGQGGSDRVEFRTLGVCIPDRLIRPWMEREGYNHRLTWRAGMTQDRQVKTKRHYIEVTAGPGVSIDLLRYPYMYRLSCSSAAIHKELYMRRIGTHYQVLF